MEGMTPKTRPSLGNVPLPVFHDTGKHNTTQITWREVFQGKMCRKGLEERTQFENEPLVKCVGVYRCRSISRISRAFVESCLSWGVNRINSSSCVFCQGLLSLHLTDIFFSVNLVLVGSGSPNMFLECHDEYGCSEKCSIEFYGREHFELESCTFKLPQQLWFPFWNFKHWITHKHSYWQPLCAQQVCSCLTQRETGKTRQNG